MKKLRILLVDDHTVMRTGLRVLLERQTNLEVAGEAENGRDAVALSASLQPNVVVMDVGIPLLNGIEATKAITTVGSTAPRTRFPAWWVRWKSCAESANF